MSTVDLFDIYVCRIRHFQVVVKRYVRSRVVHGENVCRCFVDYDNQLVVDRDSAARVTYAVVHVLHVGQTRLALDGYGRYRFSRSHFMILRFRACSCKGWVLAHAQAQALMLLIALA